MLLSHKRDKMHSRLEILVNLKSGALARKWLGVSTLINPLCTLAAFLLLDQILEKMHYSVKIYTKYTENLQKKIMQMSIFPLTITD